MKRQLVLALALVLSSFGSAYAQVQFAELTFEEALTKAQTENRDIFIYFWTEWCAPCRQLDSIVFADSAVATLINEYVPLKLDAEAGQGADLNARYEIGGYPTFLFLNAEGEELGRVTGTRLNEDYVVVIRSRGREDPGGERLRRLLEQQKDGQ